MKRIAFADESGVDVRSPCYSIGAVSLDLSCVSAFEKYFQEKLVQHGVVGEAKWKKTTTSHGIINFALDALDSIIRSQSGAFDVIVVNKAQFRKWNSPFVDREEAFYLTYTQLLKHITDRFGYPAEIYIDDRMDRYEKSDERMLQIGNNMLAQLASKGQLECVKKIDSHKSVGVQIADMLTGAINAAHARFINPRLPLHRGKNLAIARLAEMLGWDDLCYDTRPSRKVNIWHFPIEFRNSPATLPVGFGSTPHYVSAGDVFTPNDRAISASVERA